jgi:hypothetical protein
VIPELPIRVLVLRDALRRARPANVGAADREPALIAETPVDRRRIGEVVLPVGAGLEDDGPGRRYLGVVQGDGDPDTVCRNRRSSGIRERYLPRIETDMTADQGV